MLLIKVDLLKVKSKEKENFMGWIRKLFMMDNGKMEKNMVKELFIIKKRNIKECSYKANLMAMELYIMVNQTYTKANSNKTNAMVKAL